MRTWLYAAAFCLTVASAAAESVVLRARGAMFFADVTLNGRLLQRAMIDTGATFVSLCGSQANALGLKLNGTVTLSTANGMIQAKRAVLQSVRIGGVEVRDVDAVVDVRPSCEKPTLIGMSFLKHLQVEINAGRMTLTKGKASHPPTVPVDTHELLLIGSAGALVATLFMSLRRQRRSRSWHRSANEEARSTSASFAVRSLFD